MENHLKKQSTNQTGFALLMTLIVVSAVLAIGLSMLDLSTKQVRLSTNAKDSEIAFNAANAGVECARYWRRQNIEGDVDDIDMEVGDDVFPKCFGEDPEGSNTVGGDTTAPAKSVGSDGDAYLYEYDFTWGGAGNTSCTKVSTLVMSADQGGNDMSVTNMLILFPGYPDVDNTGAKECVAGARCTVISVKGYNRACSVVDSSSNYGVIEREVLIEF